MLWLKNYLEQEITDGMEVEYGRALSMLMMNYGLTNDKANEYLEIVIWAGDYKLNQGKIVRNEPKTLSEGQIAAGGKSGQRSPQG